MSETPSGSPSAEQAPQKKLSLRDRIRNHFNPTDNAPANPSRRRFVENAAKAAMVLPLVNSDIANGLADFAEGIDKRKVPEDKEKENPPAHTEFIDFVFDDPKVLLQQVLGDRDRSSDIHTETAEYKTHESDYILSNDKAISETAILNKILKEKQGHGELTTKTFVEMANRNNVKVETPHITPLEPMLTTSFEYDDLGNVTAKVTVDTEKMAEAVAKLPREMTVINLSLLVGESQEKFIFRRPTDLPKKEYFDPSRPDDFFYILQDPDSPDYYKGNVPVDKDGNTLKILTEDEYNQKNEAFHQEAIAEYKRNGKSEKVVDVTSLADNTASYNRVRIEAYNEALAAENLRKLIGLAMKFPEKTFICAGGNENDNFYWARKDIDEHGTIFWPSNLIMVGAFGSGTDGADVESDGCDVYLVDSQFSWLNDGGWLSASEATAAVSSVANALDTKLKKKIPDAEQRAGAVQRILMNVMTEDVTYKARGVPGKDEEELVKREGKAFSPRNVKAALDHDYS